MTGPHDDAEDDFDFNDFDNAISSGEGNLEFDKNVTEGIELGCDGGATEQDEDDYAGMEHNEDQEADDLECPSFEELLLAISSDDEEKLMPSIERTTNFPFHAYSWGRDAIRNYMYKSWAVNFNA
ncbi:Hypothetical predicted protein [Olea europaea subsp. europaea]|uniref:Uncharacterized protein n=1 Tax=Olea europaea subsp. europaea TaxID=158383 RepID=A0A8S0UU47_OLEEU|nr:Hypothetical predicted protein [Olea europaea subsp. europaea]